MHHPASYGLTFIQNKQYLRVIQLFNLQIYNNSDIIFKIADMTWNLNEKMIPNNCFII